jgi:ABC-type antimicrobial peptide transport system permease subunit
VIGYGVAFPSSAAGKQSAFVGQTATLKIASGRTSQSYTVPVVGVLQSYGASIIPIDTSAITSMPAAEALLHRTSFNEILVKATNTSSVSALSTLITDIYGSNARVLNTQQLAATASSIIGSITVLLLVIAGISLFVASIGIMNIMLMAVLEKTHEIGIMKSIGFKSKDVLVIFLFQALIIGTIGGIIGIFLGAAASYGLAAVAASSSSSTTNSTSSSASGSSSFGAGAGGARGGFSGGAPAASGGGAVFAGGGASSGSSSSSGLSFQPVLSVSTIAEALFVAILVSALAGIYPAWRASQMQPIDALRQL